MLSINVTKLEARHCPDDLDGRSNFRERYAQVARDLLTRYIENTDLIMAGIAAGTAVYNAHTYKRFISRLPEAIEGKGDSNNAMPGGFKIAFHFSSR